jgi:hypothetical protein
MLVLLAAIMSENEDMVRTAATFIQNGVCARPDIAGINTPLQAAVEQQNEELVGALLDSGANVNARPGRLIGRGINGPSRTALQSAVENGNLRLINILLNSGADVNAMASARESGATALQLAAINGFLGIGKLLLDKGADPNAPRCRYHGRTALEGAAEYGRLDMVQLLLAHGAKIEGKGRRQYIRAVKFAQRGGHHAVEHFLKMQLWSNENEEMLRKEELVEEDCYHRDEWSDEEEMNNYLHAEDASVGDQPDIEEVGQEGGGWGVESVSSQQCELGSQGANDLEMDDKAESPSIQILREHEEAQNKAPPGCQRLCQIEGASIETGRTTSGGGEHDWLNAWDDLVNLPDY